MTLRPAEYKKQLSDYKLLQKKAVLESKLFESEVMTVESESNWVADFDMIFSILQRNYKNPKAMNCFIFYDIRNNKLRVQIAKYLLQKGTQRIQKSVYFGQY